MKRYFYGAILVAVFILLVGGTIFLLKQPPKQDEVEQQKTKLVEPLTKPAEPIKPSLPSATTGTLMVTSEPSGATVILTDVEKGVTPLEIPDLEFGKYVLKLQLKGYQNMQQEVDLTNENSNQNIPITLEKAIAPVGTLVVESEPPGAFIVIGNRVLGVTPKSLPNTRVGKYNVTLKKDGYEDYTGSIRVAQDKTITLTGTLKEIPKPVVVQEPPKPVEPEVRVGQLVQSGPDVVPPKPLQKIYPSFPEAAKFKKLEGTVKISVLVDENGQVIDMKILKSAHPILDETVLKAYKQWTFQPATKKGVRVKMWVSFSMTFQTSR